MADLFAVANEKASPEDLVNVTIQIEASWEKIALLLEPRMFDGGRITVIKKEHDSEFTRANAMLQQWSDKFDRTASRRQLIVAMCKAELVAQVRTVFGQELVDYVQRQSGPPQSGVDPLEKSHRDVIFPCEFENQGLSSLYGRDKSMKQLILKFWGDNAKLKLIDQCIIQVVWGLGGCGKTTVAGFYARQFQKYYSGGVFLFNAQSTPALHQSLKNHIVRLTRKPSVAHASLQEDYQLFLSLLSERGNVLIVFDSCDKQSVIDRLLPTADTKCHVIVTTRYNKGGSLLDRRAENVIPLGKLEEQDAVQATLCWAERSADLSALDDEELSIAKKIVNAPGIEGLPLAVRHVGLLLKECQLSYKQYLETMIEQKLTVKDMDEFLKYCGLPHLRDALSKDGITEVTDVTDGDLSLLSTPITPLELKQLQSMQRQLQSDSVITWELDIQEVKKRSPIARTVLDAASLLDCKHIDKDLLLKYTFTDCSKDTTSKGKLHMATSLLSQFCLLEEDTGRTYHMHSLVQQSIVEGMVRDGTLSSKLCSLSKCLTDMLPQTGDDIKRNLNNSRMLELTPNIYMVASHILTSEQQDLECWQLLKVACWMAIHLQHLTDAEELCKQRLKLARSTKMPKRLLESLLEYGYVQILLENPQLALQPLQEALDLSRTLGGKLEPKLCFEALNRMAVCLMRMKQFENAERLFYEALSFAEKSGLSAVNISYVYNNLAIMYDERGKTDLAIENYQQSLAKIRLEPGVNQLELSRTLHNLATCYYRSGQLEDAQRLFEEALSSCRKELPPSHPILAQVLEGLASTFHAMGDRDEAVKLQTECVDIKKRSLPEQHAHTGRSLVNLGHILCDKGDFRNALIHVESGLAILQKKDPTGLFTADGLCWLAKCKRGLGQLPEAYQHYNECLSLRQAIYPDGHRATRTAERPLQVQEITEEMQSAGSPNYNQLVIQEIDQLL